jgi:hypothetical protein
MYSFIQNSICVWCAYMIIDMTIGMVLGMVASPIMMKAIKAIRQRRKVNRILREAAEVYKINK